MTVEELLTELAKMPADAQICLVVSGAEYDGEVSVELSDDGWVVLEG